MTPKLLTATFRRSLSVATFVAFVSSSIAQLANTPATPAAKKASVEEEAIKLSTFEVTMTQDKGYNVGNAGNALKTGETIMKIPQSLTVITRDMIDDTSSFELSDIINYFGVGNGNVGDTAQVRGFGSSILTNGAADSTWDPSSIDSITVVRGPAAVLYGSQSLTGLVLRNVRVPTGKRGGSISGRFDQWGAYRGDLDLNLPLGTYGEAKFDLRFDASKTGGKLYQHRMESERQTYYLIGQMKKANTTMRLSGYFLTMDMYLHKNNPLDPHTGRPYRGAGLRESFYHRDASTRSQNIIFRTEFLQKLWDGWDLRLAGTAAEQRTGPDVSLLTWGMNFQTNEITFVARRNDFGVRNFVPMIDLAGKYKLWGRNMQTTLGAVMTDFSSYPSFFAFDRNFAALNGQAGVPSGSGFDQAIITRPMNAPAIDTIILRPAWQYVLPYATSFTEGGTIPQTNLPNTSSQLTPPVNILANHGTRSETWTTNVFIQQNVEVIRNRLNLVASVTQFNQVSESETVSVPRAPVIRASVSRQGKMLKRFGAVVNVTKEIALYALQSETMEVQRSFLIDGSITPPVQGLAREVGFKTDLWDGRISSTVGFYKIRRENVARTVPGVSPITGTTYVVLDAYREHTGCDVTMFLRPLPTWQVTINAFKGDIKDHNGNRRFAGKYTSALTFYSRYTFTSDALKKFSIGGGAYRYGGRLIGGSGGGTVLRDGTRTPGNLHELAADWMTSAFVAFKLDRHWTFSLNVNNVLNKDMALGYQHAGSIDIAIPRTASFSAAYRF